MTLSNVFYKAACRFSDRVGESVCYGPFTCFIVDSIGGHKAHDTWGDLMSDGECGVNFMNDVDEAAAEVEWGECEYRAFMLLMASEAVK